jgi:glycosyltransferase involved in cell wall biosynthesis
MYPINVLWVIDHVCYDGSLHGGGRLYWNVAPRFDSKRFRIVSCMLRASNTVREVFAASPTPVQILDKGKFDPTTVWTFLRLIRQENIDVMHLHCYGASTFGRIASLITGVPAVIHDYDTEVYFPYPWYLRLADKMLAPMTPAAIAASPMVAAFLANKRKMDRTRIHTMFHAVPPEKYIPVPREKLLEVRQTLQAGEQSKVVLTLTKLGPQRGNEYLLKAAAETLKALPEALFLLIYKPTYFHRLPNEKYVPVSRDRTNAEVEELEIFATQLGIEKNLRFVEWPENIDEWVACCDLVVAPFLSERFSSAHLLEAIAKGKPVIATDMGEQREIVRNGVNGYLVPPGDVEELGRKIVHLLSKPEELNRFGREARAVSYNYSVDSYVQKLQRLYEQMAPSRSLLKRSRAQGDVSGDLRHPG